MNNGVPNVYLQQRRRLRKVVDFIGREALDCRCDAQVTLGTLALLACWTPEHLVRMYRRATGEPPMATIRRVRLNHAAGLLRSGASIADAADAARYASTQAFARAFRACFGTTPAEFRINAQRTKPASDAIAIVRIDEDIPCHALSLRGPASDVSTLFDETVWRLQRSRSPRNEWQVFGATAGDARPGKWAYTGGDCEVEALVVAPLLSREPRHMKRLRIPAGTYARVAAREIEASRWEDALSERGWRRADGAILRHYETDPAHVVEQERREWMYFPVR